MQNLKCKGLRKTISPKCKDNENCKWIVGKGCKNKNNINQVKNQVKCKGLKKTIPPKCKNNENCEWIVGKGCKKKGLSDSDLSITLKKTKKDLPYSDLRKIIISDAKSNSKYSKIVNHINLSGDGMLFNKGFEVMKYKELRPREIEHDPNKLKKYKGWYLSEKIDGWQAIWDGKGTLYTKSFKKTFSLPEYWLQLLPPIPLIGEIKIHNLPATKVATLASSKGKESEYWRNTYFYVFDFGSKYHSLAPFSERYELLRKLINIICFNIPICPIKLLEQKRIFDINKIYNQFKNIVKNKGEGIILTSPSSVYLEKNKRVADRVKLKGRNDNEGIVLGYNMSDTIQGSLGSLNIEILDGKNRTGIVFRLGLGFKKKERLNYKKTFPLNTIVTYSFRELTENGLPKEARFVRIRKDL